MLPAVLDQTVLATALPTIAAQLGSIDGISHLVTVYVLASTATTPLWGKLGDRHGRRALLGGALSLFLIGSAACGVAQTFEQLLVARGIQGVAAGGLMSLAMASVGDLVSPRERARWQGRIATVFAGAAVAGPLIGGLLVEHDVVALGLLRQPARRPARAGRSVALSPPARPRAAAAPARRARRRPAGRRQRRGAAGLSWGGKTLRAGARPSCSASRPLPW